MRSLIFLFLFLFTARDIVMGQFRDEPGYQPPAAPPLTEPDFVPVRPGPAVDPVSEQRVDAAAWAIADAESGVLLGAHEARKRMQVGSLMKVATAMVVMDWAATRGADLSQAAMVPQSAAFLNNSYSVGLQPGDRIPLREALYAALMQSDNVAAETLATHVGNALGASQSEKAASDFFVAQMNALARKLGMKNTRFLNAHGLDDRENPYSTAGDMVLLAQYALKHAGFVFYVSQRERRIGWSTANGEPKSYLLRNTNELVGESGIDGLKTGTTKRAGPCVMITSAKAPESRSQGTSIQIRPRRVVVVVLGSPNRFETARLLLRRGWQLFDQWSAQGRPVQGWKPAR
jgi:D-alanyl-D-alanine carboxypeptidase (penicillin-binding protein 5/6)